MVNVMASGSPLEPFVSRLSPSPSEGSYVPAPLPRRFGMSSELREVIDEAEWALGRLSGVTEFIDNPGLLMRPHIMAEAVASAHIDSGRATLSETLVADSDPQTRARSDVKDVTAIYDMSMTGARLIEQGPINRHVIAELHRTLMKGTPGFTDGVNTFRDKTHFVKVPGPGPKTLRPVPAPADFPSLLADWEDYLLTPPHLPLVLRAALVHHRIEIIQPFTEGTGRISRALVSLMLSKEGGFGAPIVGISQAINNDLLSYHQAIYDATESGDVERWVEYFARLIHHEATRVQRALVSLHQLKESMREEVRAEPLSLFAFVHLLFGHPIMSVPLLQSSLELSERHAHKVITRAEKMGWIRPLWRPESGSTPYWWAPNIWVVHSTDAPTF